MKTDHATTTAQRLAAVAITLVVAVGTLELVASSVGGRPDGAYGG